MRNPTPLSPKPQPAVEPRPIFTVQFPPAVYARVKAIAREDERTSSWVVRKAVQEFIDAIDRRKAGAA
jgi:predicted transcriptional regulator